jgi:hypothetical protein
LQAVTSVQSLNEFFNGSVGRVPAYGFLQPLPETAAVKLSLLSLPFGFPQTSPETCAVDAAHESYSGCHLMRGLVSNCFTAVIVAPSDSLTVNLELQ